MKLALYIYRMFFPLFLAAMATFAFILEMVDLMMNIWRYIYNSVPMSVVGTIMLNFLPRTFTWAMPLAFLFASCFMLSTLSSNNELTALFASGVSLIEFTVPILALSAIFSGALFLFQDKVVVNASLKYEQVKSAALNQEKDLDNDNIVIISDGGKKIYKADYFDNDLQRLRNLCVVIRGEDKELRSIVFANYASWSEDHWRAQNGREYRYENGEMKCFPLSREVELTLVEQPETFRNNTVSVESATISESRAYIDHLKKTGLPFSEALSQYY
ncbi:MAG: LptF/LptG family permease, partial [Treponemataceae bacterium]|nr:LptF/LptG family permease [Treponemataceae bacterium]